MWEVSNDDDHQEVSCYGDKGEKTLEPVGLLYVHGINKEETKVLC